MNCEKIMAINIIERKIRKTSNEVFVEKNGELYTFPKKVGFLETATSIIPTDYILVQEGNKATRAISIKQNYGGNNQEGTIKKVLKDGLTVPTPGIFMPHYKNVNDALKEESVLYYASGDLIKRENLKDYVNMLNHDCWVWLNGKFVKGSGFKGLDLETVVGLDEKGKFITNREPLEDSLNESCYAELSSLNSQGFPTQKAHIQEFEPGETFFFLTPGKDCNFCFDTSTTNGARLYIDSKFGFLNNSLNVFTCAEGK